MNSLSRIRTGRPTPPRLECSACAVGRASGVGRGQFCPFVERIFRPGAAIYREGEAADHVWFVRAGTVVLEREERACAVRFAGAFIGLEALIGPIHRDTAVAATEVGACGATRTGVDCWLGPSGSPARTALELTLRSTAADRPRESLTDGPAVRRLARWLLDEGPRGVTLGIPRHVIADLLGMRAETLSRALADLVQRGAIAITRTTLRITDERALGAVAAG